MALLASRLEHNLALMDRPPCPLDGQLFGTRNPKQDFDNYISAQLEWVMLRHELQQIQELIHIVKMKVYLLWPLYYLSSENVIIYPQIRKEKEMSMTLLNPWIFLQSGKWKSMKIDTLI